MSFPILNYSTNFCIDIIFIYFQKLCVFKFIYPIKCILFSLPSNNYLLPVTVVYSFREMNAPLHSFPYEWISKDALFADRIELHLEIYVDVEMAFCQWLLKVFLAIILKPKRFYTSTESKYIYIYRERER